MERVVSAELFLSLRSLIESKILDDPIISYLLPYSIPHDFETYYWDYKSEIPEIVEAPSREDKDLHNYKISCLLKDAVSFYNSYGGYILFGVEDGKPNTFIGCDSYLNVSDFNQRLSSLTGRVIECFFKKFEISGKSFGVLFIPRRPTGQAALGFKKNGPKINGKAAFQATVYVRINDQCRPAADSPDDWAFLCSDRSIKKDKDELKKRVVVASNLPARDTDLVKFVGRDDVMKKLRSWFFDIKSPVRLLTGIGGLGKTTVAYKFAEEVSVSGAGEVERIVWVTAKQTTYSSLVGKLVETNSVDFTDIVELFEQLIIQVAGHTSIPEDGSIRDLTEALIEVLQIYPCLIIVDDLDSLPPGMQRECASELLQVALRLVDRDHSPTRILMTSRLEQGLSPTSIFKVSGLDTDSFNEHVRNLCEMFELVEVNNRDLKRLHKVTSGSPLFIGSLMRLVKQGENIKTLCDNWSDSYGEDVREFAFQRELVRLNQNAAKTLLAVILLDKASLADLVDVLDTSKNRLREWTSELQTFHLLAHTENQYGDTMFSASKDLIAVSGILKKHLGSNAKFVEQGCARIKKENQGGSRVIGIKIREISTFWSKDEFNEALVVAKKLSASYPKNGDVASMLGATYLKFSPPQYEQADKILEKAKQLRCERPELFLNLIKAKQGCKDWQGLLALTADLSSNRKSNDNVLNGFIEATNQLLKISLSKNQFAKCSDLAIAAVERIDAKISGQALTKSYFSSLKNEQERLSLAYLHALNLENTRPGDRLNVFNGLYRLVLNRVIVLKFIVNGCDCLKSWWSDVEGRPVVDLKACDILQEQLRKINQITDLLSSVTRDKSNMLEILNDTHRELSFRAGKLQ